jgi:hypothetical protein
MTFAPRLAFAGMVQGLVLGMGLAIALWSASASAAGWFDLAKYRDLKGTDRPTLEFVLAAMYEAVFYAQESVGRPVICASPVPIPGTRLIELIDVEVASPTNPTHQIYTQSDHVAFVLLNALKAEGACK